MTPYPVEAQEDASRTPFRDRHDAGRLLARKLRRYAGRSDTLVLALPRGGVPVAFEVALALDLPLDVCVVRRLAAPGRDSITLGAVAAGGSWILDEAAIQKNRVDDRTLREVAERAFRELRSLEESYRGGQPALDIRGRTVILVDEGATTGLTLFQAATALRRHAPVGIVAAVPTASAAARARVDGGADEWVGLFEPDPFSSVGLAYLDFTQPSLELVRNLLRFAARAPRRRR